MNNLKMTWDFLHLSYFKIYSPFSFFQILIFFLKHIRENNTPKIYIRENTTRKIYIRENIIRKIYIWENTTRKIYIRENTTRLSTNTPFCVVQLQVWGLKIGLQKLEVGLHHFMCRPTSSLGVKNWPKKVEVGLHYVKLGYTYFFGHNKLFLAMIGVTTICSPKVSRFNALIMPVLI